LQNRIELGILLWKIQPLAKDTLSRKSAKEHCMRLLSWHPPVEPSSFEQTIITRIKRAKLFVFLRHHRYELFDDAFQEELAALYAPSRRGQPPIPPAQLALATIVQAYIGASDDEVIEAP
jgi:transposase